MFFSRFCCPEGPRIEKIQSREAILKKSSFQYGMEFSIENEIFIPGPSLAAAQQGLGLKFSIENEIFKPRTKISSENENFMRGGMVFSCVRARMNFFRSPGPLGGSFADFDLRTCRASFRFLSNIDSVHTRCIVKTSGFTRVFVKIRDFIKF